MTHYGELIMSSPLPLIVFMLLPMFLVEFYVITKVLLLIGNEIQNSGSIVYRLNRISLFAAALTVTVLSVSFFLRTYTKDYSSRGLIDELASISYSVSFISVLVIFVYEKGLAGKNLDGKKRAKYILCAITSYLVLSHAAMTFGMINPSYFKHNSHMTIEHQHSEHHGQSMEDCHHM